MRPSLDRTMLDIAAILAKRGTCARRQVGCVITDSEGCILSGGYNGVPAGSTHCIDVPCEGAKNTSGSNTSLYTCEAIHAEQNALIRCNITKMYTCFVTCSPCIQCVKLLITAGCMEIVFSEKSSHHDEAFAYWSKHCALPYQINENWWRHVPND